MKNQIVKNIYKFNNLTEQREILDFIHEYGYVEEPLTLYENISSGIIFMDFVEGIIHCIGSSAFVFDEIPKVDNLIPVNKLMC